MGTIRSNICCHYNPLSVNFRFCCPAYFSMLKPVYHVSGTPIEDHFIIFPDFQRIGTCFITSIHYSAESLAK